VLFYPTFKSLYIKIKNIFGCCNDDTIRHSNMRFYATPCPQSMQVQSAEVADLPADAPTEVMSQQTVSFAEENQGTSAGYSASDATENIIDQTPGVDLGDFLSRPTRIMNVTWAESQAVGTTLFDFRPWYVFFSDPRISSKLNNYSWLRCDLKMKIIVTSSPFYYGAVLSHYRPVVGVNDDTVTTSSSFSEFVPYSQRPHVWIYPQDNMAGDITLPFFYHKNWLNLQSASQMQDMGQYRAQVVSALQSANGATGAGVTIQIYAWAENVQLSGPSLGLSVQSRDEYGAGMISAPASAIANMASKLESLPLIGKFATATKIGANAIGSISSMFGFTNVPVINDVQSFKPVAFPPLATTDIGYSTQKLTLDAKNELTVDPGVLGLDGTDELSISYLVQKESFLTSTTWFSSDAVDSQLFKAAITPWMFRNDATSAQNQIQLPPCAWIANMFECWRGDVIFRFKFIASKYHRGRVKISFDPSGQGANNLIQIPESTNAIFTHIVDLGVDSVVEMRIPYNQAVPWLRTQTNFTNDVWNRRSSDTGAGFIYDPTLHNGMLTMRVLTTLTAPVATTQIDLLISVRGAENLEFANPEDIGSTFSPYSIQSREVYDTDCPITIAGNATHTPQAQEYLIHYGEAVKSLRQVLRRASLNEVWAQPSDTTSYQSVLQHDMTRWPVPYGYDAGGLWSAAQTANPSVFVPFNWTQSTPLNWVMPAFVAVRGSAIWTFNAMNTSGQGGSAQVQHVRVIRRPHVGIIPNRNTTILATKGSTSVNSKFFRDNFQLGAGGSALTNGYTNAGISVLLPNYNRFRFQSTSPARITAPVAEEGSQRDTSRLEVLSSPLYGTTTRSLVVEKYVSIGTDFNLHWFLNVPTSFFYISAITPNPT
jgi:hypothetical protein